MLATRTIRGRCKTINIYMYFQACSLYLKAKYALTNPLEIIFYTIAAVFKKYKKYCTFMLPHFQFPNDATVWHLSLFWMDQDTLQFIWSTIQNLKGKKYAWWLSCWAIFRWFWISRGKGSTLSGLQRHDLSLCKGNILNFYKSSLNKR